MDFQRFVGSRLYTFFDRLFYLVVINMIWFFLVVIGFGIFTLLPATVTLFILVNTFVQEKEFPIFKAFFLIFFQEYWRIQKVFLLFLIVGLILYINVRSYYVQIINETGLIGKAGFALTIIMILIYLMTFMQIFMIFLYYPKHKTLQKIKYSFLFAAAYPFRTIFLIIILGAGILILLLYPVLLPMIFLIFMSLFAYVAISVMKPKYDKLLPDIESLTVNDYLE